jgi:hypothetical protein
MSSQAHSTSEPVVAITPARTESSMPYRILISVGLAIGAVLGLGGSFLPAGECPIRVSALDSHCRDAGGNPICGARVAVAAGPFAISLGTTCFHRLCSAHRRDRRLDYCGPASRAIVAAITAIRWS